jgi:hypothetical protein
MYMRQFLFICFSIPVHKSSSADFSGCFKAEAQIM